jgi:uncharacterized membrane protein YozB (DUF420 family)
MTAAVSAGDGVAFIVSYGIVAEIIAKACSSPQTAEINAHSRATTLMKWVNIGVAESIVVIIIAAWIDSKVPGKNHTSAIIAGGVLAIVVTYGEYMYAKKAGLSSDEPGTES